MRSEICSYVGGMSGIWQCFWGTCRREPHFKEKIKAFGFIFSLFLIYLFTSIQDLEIHQCQRHFLFFFSFFCSNW